MKAVRTLSVLAAGWATVALGAWIAALLGAPIMVTLGDHVAGMIYGAFGCAVLALVHATASSVAPPRWVLPVALTAQLMLLSGAVAASVATGVRVPGLVAAAIGWAAVTVGLARTGALALTTAAAAAGLGALAAGRLDLGTALGVHGFLVPAVVVLAERVDRGPHDVPVVGERVIVGLALLRAIARPVGEPIVTIGADALLVLALGVALLDRGPWSPGPRSGAFRLGLLWVIAAYAGDALALALGDLVGSLPTHAALVGGVGTLLVASATVIGEGRVSTRSTVALVLVQVAALLRVVPLALGHPSALAMVGAAATLAAGLAVGLWIRRPPRASGAPLGG